MIAQELRGLVDLSGVDEFDTPALAEAIRALSLRERAVPFPMRDAAGHARIKALEAALDQIWEH